ncbi:histidinol-phosphate transaminase [Helicobacter sp. 11S03491-1]|uniref:histidinol-phosphate transaminase n=1 Tax=Helicobacter sp. 11S03491-1 TaxID=1476196 RepID=UPI000BA74238|nr:histidinol-phosphate transaminase [Helicobacter sp. 11S03491-1]PAF43852.1 histidinol-phosphate transaminase [Helicobacter sp. 11S03491-1]
MNFNRELANIVVYEAGKPIELLVREFGIDPNHIIKLASNENPYGCSPKASAAIEENIKKVSLYPDDSMFELKAGLAQKYALKSENIIIGSGSDQIIEFCLHAKCNQKSSVLMAKTTFAMYEIYAKQVGAKIIKTPSHSHNISEFIQLYKLHLPEVVFLCVPNNPLGECLDKNQVYEFISQTSPDTLVVIDGAYQEFAQAKDKNKAINPAEILEKFKNVIYLGTFSKAYGLGGMRVGYGLASDEIIKILHKIRPPFNIGILSLEAAISALKDEEFVKNSVHATLKEMQKYEDFAKKNAIDFIPSWTNFITFILNDNFSSTQLCDWLLQKGVIIRNLKSYGMNAVRITIGKPDQNHRVFELIEEFLDHRRSQH